MTDASAKNSDLYRELIRGIAQHSRQAQAHTSLLNFLKLDNPFPVLDYWMAAPDALLYLANHVARGTTSSIVECGSGVSTLVLARTIHLRSPQTRLVAVEDSLEHVEKTKELLQFHGLSDRASVRHAPLVDLALDGHDAKWFDPAALDDVDSVDLLWVDGPIAAGGRLARYPAVPMLADRFAPGCVVLLDDASRAQETAVSNRWAEGELRGYRRTDVELIRGLCRFDGPAA